MSVYNGNILTRIIDPVYDSQNFKTEFRLNAPDVAYLSNMRLINMGIASQPLTNYDSAVGAFCMESIQLYDGNVLLDQVLNASIWNTWKNLNTTNDANMSVESVIKGHQLGYMAEGAAKYSATDRLEQSSFPVEVYPVRSIYNQTDNSALFDLKSFLPFLTSIMTLSTRTFKNLRLVINWKNPAQLKDLVQLRTTTLNTQINTALVVDMVQSPDAVDALTRAYKGHTWQAVENDRVFVQELVPPADSTEVQDVKVLVNGFNNKTLHRLNVVQTPLEQGTWVNGNNTLWGSNQTSVATWNTQFQFRVNGANKLPRDGFTKRNQRLAQLTEAYGEVNLFPTQNFTYVPIMTAQLSGVTNVSYGQGKVDYTAVEIKERVNELQLLYKRTGVAGNNLLNQPLHINLFGEVSKSLEVNGDSYRIFYS